jgi:hypothetical protein
VLAGEPQEAGELGQGVGQAGDRGGVAVVVAVSEGVRPLAGLGDAWSPGSASMSSKISQKAALTSAWAWAGTLASRLRAR